MKPLKYAFFGLVFWIFNLECKAELIFTASIRDAYLAAVDFRQADCQTLLSKAKTDRPANKLCLLIDVYNRLPDIFFSENEKVQDRILADLSSFRSQIEEESDNNAWKRHCLGELYLFEALIESRKGNSISAALAARSAYRMLRANEEAFPSFTLSQKSLAAMQMFIGSMPSSYRKVFSVLGMSGSSTKSGENKLVRLLNHLPKTPFACFGREVEIIFAFAKAQTADPNFQAAEWINKRGAKDAPKAWWLGFAVACRKYERASYIPICTAKLADVPSIQPFVVYLDACTAYFKNDWPKVVSLAQSYFGSGNLSFSWELRLKAATAKAMMGQSGQEYVSWIQSHDNPISDNDKEAKGIVSRGENYKSELMIVRACFDGGFYDLAKNKIALIEFSKSSVAFRAEYYYRKGRIFQRKGEYSNALAQFNQAIYTDPEGYFACLSAFHSGQVQELQKKKAEAIKAYRRCEDINADRASSIVSKAKFRIELMD